MPTFHQLTFLAARTINGLIGRLPWTRPMIPATLAAKISWSFFFVLLVIAAVGWAIQKHYGNATNLTYLCLGALGLIVLPLLVYAGLLWLVAGRDQNYPEIDVAWNKGTKFLDRHRLELADVPLILVLGTEDFDSFQALHHSESAQKYLSEIGSLPADYLYWGRTEETLYLHLHQCSWVSAIQGSAGNRTRQSGAENDEVEDRTENLAGVPRAQSANTLNWQNDSNLDFFELSETKNSAIHFGDDSQSGDKRLPALAKSGEHKISERLRYVCSLLRQTATTSVSPHGLIVRLPFQNLLDPDFAEASQQALLRDLLVLNRELEVSLPVTIMFTGLETDKGFLGLCNFLGSEQAAVARFGVGCRVTEVPRVNAANLEVFVERLVQYVNKHLLSAYQSSKNLHEFKSNQDLFRFGAAVRQTFSRNLKQLLNFCLLSEQLRADPAFYLTGCYFGMLGDRPSQWGFINGVREKAEEFQVVAHWSDRMIRRGVWRVCWIGLSLLMGSLLAVINLWLLFRK